MTPDDPVGRDAWLREALRHAPDADARPPATLRDAILRQANAARSRPTLWQRIETGWSWLARPPVAAGIASVTLSTVIVVMWWKQPAEEFPRPMASQRMAQAPAAPSVPALPQPAPEAPPAVAEQPAPAPKATPARAKPQRAPAPPPPAATAPAPRTEGAAAAAAEPALQDPGEARPASPAPAGVMAKRERMSTDAMRRSAESFASAAPPAMADPLPALSSLLAAPASELRWTLGERSLPHRSAQQAWFERLRNLTAGRWQRVAAPTPDGTPLRLFEGEQLRAEFFVSGQQVLWLSPQGAWLAPLDEADANELQAQAARW